MSAATTFANRVLNELDDEFESDSEYVEALEELIDQAEAMLTAKNEELEREQGDD